MTRSFDKSAFDSAYRQYVGGGKFQEIPEYYPRYISRYRAMMERYCSIADDAPIDVLDIGGGQLALLAKILYGDRAAMADIGGPNMDYLRGHGIETITWNLCADEQPIVGRFDVILFSEVIEHLAIPGHIVLERLRKALKPGGRIVLSTPNLYRLRNIVYMALGIQIFDHFRYPTNVGIGHVLEYSKPHLEWQMREAGFENIHVDLRQFHHLPNHWLERAASVVASPLFLVPRWRDNLLAVASAPAR